MLSTVLSLTLLTARPDVVLVTIDTLRADRVGAYGSKRGLTPALDALAGKGVVVEDAVVQIPQTRPSHASILTGLLPFQHGIRDNASPPLGRDIPTLASTLKAAGYATAAFIGAYPVSRASGLDRGFDVFDDPFVGDADFLAGAGERNERPAREVVDAALAWLPRAAIGVATLVILGGAWQTARRAALPLHTAGDVFRRLSATCVSLPTDAGRNSGKTWRGASCRSANG